MKVTALSPTYLDIPSGKFIAIMGPSGSGKSTLLHVLSTLDAPNEVPGSSLQIGGVELLDKKDNELSHFRAEKIGFIFQSFNLLPVLTAEQNIELQAGLAGQRVDKLWKDQLIRTLGLQERLNHLPRQLSGGQQQRVAIARALLSRPEVVFADEPTGNLDTASGQEVLRLLQNSSRKFGQTILMVTHDPVAASFADSVLLLKDGELAGTIEQPSRESVLNALAELGA